MTGVRGVLGVRWTRAGMVRAVLPAALALALAACGTIPPAASGGGSVPVAPRTSARPTVAPTRTTTPSAIPSPTPTKAQPTKAQPTKARPAKAGSKPPADTWVGHFQGHEVWVPRGHGATMSFTFDDGPWPGSTSKVLALLKQYRVHAVFCVIGNQAQAYPSLVKGEVAGGHELCDHSRDHDLTMNKKGAKYVDAEVGDGLAQIRRAAPPGTPVRYYRQPGGLWSPAVVRAMDKRSLYPLRWSDDPKDWSRPGSAVIVRRVVAQLHPGVVILMHDGGGNRSQSVEALRFLLGAVLAAGWKPVIAPRVKLSVKAAAKPQ